MIQPKLCFVAEGVTLDRETGTASAFSIVESIQSAGFPFFIQKVSFFCLWERDDNDPAQRRGEFSITLGNQDVLRQNVDIDFLGQLRLRNVIRVNGLVIPQPGNLAFRLSIPEHTTAEYVFAIPAAPPAVQEVTQAPAAV